mgnify:CR=1 FL=1
MPFSQETFSRLQALRTPEQKIAREIRTEMAEGVREIVQEVVEGIRKTVDLLFEGIERGGKIIESFANVLLGKESREEKVEESQTS